MTNIMYKLGIPNKLQYTQNIAYVKFSTEPNILITSGAGLLYTPREIWLYSHRQNFFPSLYPASKKLFNDVYIIFVPAKSDQLRTSEGMPSGRGSFSLMHCANKRAVYYCQ